MVDKRYFSHTHSDGRRVFDMINAARITWYAAGEIIAWNNWGTLAESTTVARDGWMNSPGHRSIVLSGTYNLVGMGLAVDPNDGRKLWTGVFIKGPAVAGAAPVNASQPSPASFHVQTVRWTRNQVRPRVRTARTSYYQVQVRTDGSAWRWRSARTTARSTSVKVWAGHTYGVRVRACDRARRCGAWRGYTLGG
jgi:hypothetical protein